MLYDCVLYFKLKTSEGHQVVKLASVGTAFQQRVRQCIQPTILLFGFAGLIEIKTLKVPETKIVEFATA